MTTTVASAAEPLSTGTGVGMRTTGTPPITREIDNATGSLTSLA